MGIVLMANAYSPVWLAAVLRLRIDGLERTMAPLQDLVHAIECATHGRQAIDVEALVVVSSSDGRPALTGPVG